MSADADTAATDPAATAAPTALPAEVVARGIARAVLKHVEPGPIAARPGVAAAEHGRVRLALPGSDYELVCALAVPASAIATPEGKRLRGTIEAKALRIHPAHGGGRFIEPVYGEPRIVAGVVEAVDEAHDRVLVVSACPMWLSMMEIQDRSVVEAGGLVNCHVRDVTFTPSGA